MSTHRLSVAVALILVLQTNLVCGQFSAAPIEFKGEVGEKGARGAVGSTGVQGQTGSKVCLLSDACKRCLTIPFIVFGLSI